MKFIADILLVKELKHRIADNHNRLMRMVYAWGHNQDLAKDIAQEAICKALKNISQLKDKDALDSWLFGILINCWRDHFRKQRDTVDIDDIVLVDSITPEVTQQQQDLVDQVRAAIAKLVQGQRQVVTLIDLEEFSYTEVAAILDIPVGTVMSRLSRARKSLSEMLIEFKRKEVSGTKSQLRRIK